MIQKIKERLMLIALIGFILCSIVLVILKLK